MYKGKYSKCMIMTQTILTQCMHTVFVFARMSIVADCNVIIIILYEPLCLSMHYSESDAYQPDYRESRKYSTSVQSTCIGAFFLVNVVRGCISIVKYSSVWFLTKMATHGILALLFLIGSYQWQGLDSICQNVQHNYSIFCPQ